jgi:hypothetical protein
VLTGTTPQARFEQQEYCKGLYALAMTLGETDARRAAQWAVNVLDFRDEDSTMTAFEYDTNLANGWGVDGNPATTGEADRGVVWGVERPDILIADTAAWRGVSGSANCWLMATRICSRLPGSPSSANSRRGVACGCSGQARSPQPAASRRAANSRSRTAAGGAEAGAEAGRGVAMRSR